MNKMFKLKKCVDTALNASQNDINDKRRDYICKYSHFKVIICIDSNIKTFNFSIINVYLLINKEMDNKYA
jgi:hypothetical protein